MAFKKVSDEVEEFGKEYVAPEKNRLSYQEIIKMNSEIETMKKEVLVTVPKTETIKMTQQRDWLIQKGAITRNGSVIVKKFKSAIYGSDGKIREYADCEPILYEQLMEDWEQWCKWKVKNNFIQQKQLEEIKGW